MSTLNKYCCALATVFLTTISANAADLATQAAEPLAPISSAFNWTGFYAGLNAGYGFGSRDLKAYETDTRLDGARTWANSFGSVDPKGGFAGLQAGYNQQFGAFVVGLEGDIQGAGISDTGGGPRRTYSPTYADPDNYIPIVYGKTRVDWFGTLRPRAGYAFDNLLLYVTGGLAVGNVKNTLSLDDNNGYTTLASKNDTRVGYVLGAGAEYAFTQNWTAKLEYQYLDFGSKTLSAQEVVDGGVSPFYRIHSKMPTSFHTVRLGVNYKF